MTPVVYIEAEHHPERVFARFWFKKPTDTEPLSAGAVMLEPEVFAWLVSVLEAKTKVEVIQVFEEGPDEQAL